MTRPFGKIVVHVDYPGTVEYMARRLKRRGHHALGKCKEGRKGQPHASPLVGHGCSTLTTAHLAGKPTFVCTRVTIVKLQLFRPACQANVMFVKNGRPLHGRTVQCLTGATMTEFGVHGIGTHFQFHGLAVTTGTIFDDKVSSSVVMDERIVRPQTCRRSRHTPLCSAAFVVVVCFKVVLWFDRRSVLPENQSLPE